MAFVNRIGNVLKQTVSKHVGVESCASNSMLYQAIRSMSTKLFVGGLSYGTDDASLSQAFSQHGEVIEARIIIDRDNGRSRGFGFVTFASNEDAARAMQAMDGQDLHGRRLRVNYATEKPRAPRYDGGFSGGGFGGYQSGPYGGAGGGGGYGGGNYGNYNSGGNNYGGGGLGGNYGGTGENIAFGGSNNLGGSYATGDSAPSSFGGASFSGQLDPSTNVSGFGSGEDNQFDGGLEISDADDKDNNEEPSDYANRSG